MKRMLIIGILAGVAMLGACTKFAAMKGPFDGNEVNAAFVEYVVDKADDRLDLTDEQCDQFRAMVEKMAARALDQRPEVDALREKMADEVRKPRLDMDTMEALMKERMQLFRIIMEEEKDDFVAFHAKLSDSQRDALAQLLLNHGKKGWHSSH
ncbi:Spy/CpxP family protein refolding chaperone [Pseudodesulfovibrio thermohalotolerans]|uniref:Spy/CpxP family protein refolding chaperone n=1 Tax=Pseudodesulfovibrio thermohalotolerans TaxID=2880651 RepID=UPI0022B9F44A|nr:Spy/CpxP family protein refolding chaperone [Pseudodesulfovibrio thermohalotolerans]WFS63836.1 Spy/CpxP family protein refolding chaperone [Pseudodesulfovibrio thermohalotolerans]